MNAERFGLTSKVLEEIIQHAKTNDVEKVIIFGSRARGDYREKSDIDIAISGGMQELFCSDIDDAISTLLKFDIVCLDKPVQDELINEIDKDGVVIYENSEI
ncbi:MAG: nucleotidyltransferase domain-containing protein [Monoglobaceae bacterium]